MMDESPGIDLASSVPPTQEQLAIIRKHIEQSQARKYYVIDFTDTKGYSAGHYEYEGGANATRALADIAYFYENGRVRDAGVSQFRFSLRELQDGTKYVNVDTDQDYFAGAKISNYRKLAQNYIRDNYVGKIVGDVHPAYISSRTASEYARAEFYSDSGVMTSEMRAATELPNILDAGDFIKRSNDGGNHPEATGGWEYYTVLVAVDNRMYEGIANIMITDKGRVFYDWTQVKENAAGTAALSSQRLWPHQPGNASDNSIPPTSDNGQARNSNRPNDIRYSASEAARRDTDYLSAVETGDMKTAQQMVDDAARAAGYNTDTKLYRGDSVQVNEFVLPSQRGKDPKFLHSGDGFAYSFPKNRLLPRLKSRFCVRSPTPLSEMKSCRE